MESFSDNSSEHSINKEHKQKSQTKTIGYHDKNLDDFCGTYKEEFILWLSDKSGDKHCVANQLPKTFKILTWNIWGNNKLYDHGYKFTFLSELMMLRMKKVVESIVEKDPDVIIFQEMSFESLGIIKGYMRHHKLTSKYKGYGHNFLRYSPDNITKEIGRDLDNYVFSKFEPKSISQYSLPGNLGYTTSVTFVSFDKICIVGCYLQAGSKYSPGQEKVWRKYSRCRSEQIGAISELIKIVCPKKTTVLCGDFNMDLDSEHLDNKCLDSEYHDSEWPEIKEIQNLGMVDSWRSVYPDKKMHPGFTEDTDINHMRYNMKLLEKKFRYDGILFKNVCTTITPISTELIGTQAYQMDDDLFDEFVSIFDESTSESLKPKIGIKKERRTKTYHPSDHFGVMTSFITS